jgi:hypothetical protein
MTPEDDIPLDGGKEAEAAFGSGFPEPSVEKPAAKAADKPAKDKPEPAATPRVEATPEPPKYAQVTEAELADFKAAAAKAATHEAQLAKAWGTIGNMQKMLNEQRAAATPAAAAAIARKFEIPKEAFAAMERDFPELAQQVRAGMEAALAGLPGPGGDAHDPAKLESTLAARETKRELAILAARHPDWREIVGTVDASTGQPPPDTPFRKWLATKDQAYQDQVNSSELADVIGLSIRRFQRETTAPAKSATAARDAERAARIRDAVQPKGDNAGTAPRNTAEENFASGYAR